MQAIRTHYLCPTNSRGGRIKATAQAGSITVGWDHALDPEQNHMAACLMLCRQYGWEGDYVGGCLPDGSWCLVSKSKLSPTVSNLKAKETK